MIVQSPWQAWTLPRSLDSNRKQASAIFWVFFPHIKWKMTMADPSKCASSLCIFRRERLHKSTVNSHLEHQTSLTPKRLGRLLYQSWFLALRPSESEAVKLCEAMLSYGRGTCATAALTTSSSDHSLSNFEKAREIKAGGREFYT